MGSLTNVAGSLTRVLEEIYETKLSAAERRRLGGRAIALALHGSAAEQGTAPSVIFEEVLDQAGSALGLPAKADVGLTKAKLRATGAPGLAARVGRLSRARNVQVHDTTLPDQVRRHHSAVEEFSDAGHAATGAEPEEEKQIGTISAKPRATHGREKKDSAQMDLDQARRDLTCLQERAQMQAAELERKLGESQQLQEAMKSEYTEKLAQKQADFAAATEASEGLLAERDGTIAQHEQHSERLRGWLEAAYAENERAKKKVSSLEEEIQCFYERQVDQVQAPGRARRQAR